MSNVRPKLRHRHRQRGAAAILAMMFLVILGSLAAAMAIVSQGNLVTAESHLRINRSLAGAETGLNWTIYRVNQVAALTTTPYGLIDDTRAEELWLDSATGVRAQLYDAFSGEFHNLQEPVLTAKGLRVGPIAIGPGEPTFTVSFDPHPLPGPGGAGDFSRYDDPYYQQPPYTDTEIFESPVSSANPLDARWIRVVVTATDGNGGNEITRSISMDFRLDKNLRFAVLSRSRVMIGRNVMIEGRLGSTFEETHLLNGHPLQIASDFRGIDPALDTQLDALLGSIIADDEDGDNRLSIYNSTEVADYEDPAEDEAEMPEDEAAEPLGTTIDPAQVMAEALALALPLYPRKPDVERVVVDVTEPGKRPMTDEDVKPFAGLAGLRDRLNREQE